MLTRSDDNPTTISPKQKPNLLSDPLVLSILGLTALTNSAYAIIAPFLPFEFKKKDID